MNNISFQGVHVGSATVLKKQLPQKVQVIKLDKNDLYKVEDVSFKWKTKISGLVTKSMYFPFECKSQNIYVLSTQEKDFQKLNPNKVLALFEVLDKNKNYRLEYLDVNPKYKYDVDYPLKQRKSFTRLGEACLNFIKNRFSDKSIELDAVDSAIPFYEKQGFKRINQKPSNPMIYRHSKKNI